MSKRSCDAMRSDYISEKRSNLGTRWHWKEKSRYCCCKAPKVCQKPIGTEMALQKIRQTEMMTWEKLKTIEINCEEMWWAEKRRYDVKGHEMR